MQELINKIMNIKNGNNKWLLLLTNEEKILLSNKINFFNDIKRITELKYCLNNNITNRPKCEVCGKDKPFISGANGKYRFLCSNECSNSIKGKQLFKEYKSKIMIEYNKNDEYKQNQIKKTKKTKFERHGDENYNNMEKTKKTKFEKYKNENYCNSKKISKTYRNKTVIEKQNIKMIREKSNLKSFNYKTKFLDPNVTKKSIVAIRTKSWNTFNLILQRKNITHLFDFDYYINVDNKVFKFKCNRCNKEFITKETNAQKIRCECNSSGYQSQYEDEIIDFIKTLNIDVIHSKLYRNNKGQFECELDVFLPNNNIAIDYHGLYFHSDVYKDSLYHQNKYKYCKDKGIKLIQVFANEWQDKQHIVKSIIKSKLNVNKVIYARKSIIKELSVSEYKQFLELNHLQGYSNSKIKVGLIYNDVIVAVMGIGKPRFTKKYEYELIRFSNLLSHNVIGGFSRLLKYFERKYSPKNILSYIDVRYFDGVGYINNNFEILELLPPNYFYFKSSKYDGLHSRYKFQKAKLKNILHIFDNKKTEYENMILNNYLRIYDAGNLKVVKQY